MKKSKLNLTEDTLQSILVRLPMKDLARCKSVCKQWNTLISRHRFTVELSPPPNSTILPYCNFAGRGKSQVHQVIHNGPFGPVTVDMYPYSVGMNTECKFIGTCDGLICLSPIQAGDHAVVWNPVLHQERVLCFPRVMMENSFFFFGFGYDNVRNDYKVVKITQSPVQAIVEIWNLYCTTGSNPRAINLPSARLPFVLTNAGPVTANGSSHWVAVSLRNRNLELVRFDMESESFVEIPFSSDMPNIQYNVEINGMERVAGRECSSEICIGREQYRLGIYNTRVCLFITTASGVEVWCMDRNLDWSKKFHIRPGRRYYREEDNVILGFSANNELVTHHSNDVIYARDPNTLRAVLPMSWSLKKLSQIIPYVESLVPLYLNGGSNQN